MKTIEGKLASPRAVGMPRRILAPVDFSAPSRQAIGAAVALARRFDAELTVTHVTRRHRPDSHAVLELLSMSSDDRVAMRAKLKDFLRCEVPDDVKVTSLVLDGVPFDEIVEAAVARRSDLIVIATHGYTGLKHALLGSTAERVIRYAPCPVLVVRGREKRGGKAGFNPDSVRSILLTTDFSENSLAAFPAAVAWARAFDARLLLLYVVPERLPTEMSQLGLVLHEKRMAQEAVNRFPEFRRLNLPADVSVETRVLIGSSERAICKAGDANGADLIIMASHGYTGIKHVLIGSTAERVVQHAPCAVLVVRGKGVA